MTRTSHVKAALVLVLLGSAWLLFPGCSNDASTSPLVEDAHDGIAPLPAAKPIFDPPPPVQLVSFGLDRMLTFWPYVDPQPDGVAEESGLTPSDPVNLVFYGHAHPLEIRAALLSLDGDRTDYGLPNTFPWNCTWRDAIGDAQAAYVEGPGWVGSVIQLECGDYGAMRFHLRLWQTGISTGADKTWTIGSAHFDLMIPGTADHQVLSWEAAERLVAIDMTRSCLLCPVRPLTPTTLLNAQPSWRTIPAAIFNLLPEPLKGQLKLPLGPSSTSVPIPSDGMGTFFNVTHEPTVTAGLVTLTESKVYQQVIPKPFCNDGSKYVLVTGPVDFHKTVDVISRRLAKTTYEYGGTLNVVPWDPIHNQPIGDAYLAEVSGRQSGNIDGRQSLLNTSDIRRTLSLTDPEWLRYGMCVGKGTDCYTMDMSCAP